MLIRLLIADDHPLFRRGVCDLVQEDDRFELVAEADDGASALSAIRSHAIDIAVLDISMPGLDGLDVLTELRGRPNAPRLVVLSMHEELADRALELGAHGFVRKEAAEDELIECLLRVAEGGLHAPSASARPQRTAHVQADSVGALSPTERRILKLLAQHKTSREIAGVLGISYRTVQNHRASAVRKLELSGPQALLKFALRHDREL